MLALVAAVMWADMPTENAEDVAVIWASRIGFPIALVFAIRATLRAGEPEDLAGKLGAISPYTGTRCPVCNGEGFAAAPKWRCISCGAERHDVKAA